MLNPHLLHCKANSWPLGHQGSPHSSLKWIHPCNQLPSQDIEHSHSPEKFGKTHLLLDMVHFSRFLTGFSCLKVCESPLHVARAPSMASEQNFWIRFFLLMTCFLSRRMFTCFFCMSFPVWFFFFSFFSNVSLFLMDPGEILYGLAPLWVSLTNKVI